MGAHPSISAAENECFCDSYETVLNTIIQTTDLEDAAKRAAVFFHSKASSLDHQTIAVRRGDGEERVFELRLVPAFEITSRSNE